MQEHHFYIYVCVCVICFIQRLTCAGKIVDLCLLLPHESST